MEARQKVNTIAEATIKDPKRWDLDSPNRYLARTTIKVDGKVTDVYYTSFGVRTIEFTAQKRLFTEWQERENSGDPVTIMTWGLWVQPSIPALCAVSSPF
ncbi:MAG: hypothetical protein AB2L20_03730 [Mangrovibacterium sp.]